MSNLTHNAAIDAICNCASSVSVLSYQEAIEGYFKLRGLLIPPAPSLAAQDGLVEAAQSVLGFLEVSNSKVPAFAISDLRKALVSAIKGDKS